MARRKKGKKSAVPVAGSRAATRKRKVAQKKREAAKREKAAAKAAAVPDPWGVIVFAELREDPGNPAEYVEGLHLSRMTAEAAAETLTAQIQNDPDYLYGSADAYPAWGGPTPTERVKLVRKDKKYRAGFGATGPDGRGRIWLCPEDEPGTVISAPTGTTRVIQLSADPVAWRTGE